MLSFLRLWRRDKRGVVIKTERLAFDKVHLLFELFQCNTWDAKANFKLQSGFSGEKCLEGEPVHRVRVGGNKGMLLHLLPFGSRLMRSGIGEKGEETNQTDMSGAARLLE